jgi:hypothetical protein
MEFEATDQRFAGGDPGPRAELVARFGGQHLYSRKMSFGSKSNLRFRRVNFKV